MTTLPFLRLPFALGLLAPLAFSVPVARAADRPAASAPIQIRNEPTINFQRTDGGLLPVAGVENIEVFRSSHARPDLTDGRGYTYNHHPDMAAWHGRLYVAWDSGRKDEDTWPAHELYSTSVDGRDWTAPAELFPQGVSTPTRLYFFRAPNGRMLAFAGLRIGHVKTQESKKGGMVVREIRADHALGPVYTLRNPPVGGLPANAPAPYTTSTDAGFLQACRELLGARVTLETQDFGVLLDPDQRIKWHNPAAWPNGKIGKGFWKAPSFYHRRDGALVGIGKMGWTSVSKDNGATWSLPVIPPTLKTNTAKVWGQRTGDGRYALIYNPSPRPRYPLAIVTGEDGVVFGGMQAVQSRFTPQRYPGINKNPGLQYMRGIAEWANDGSVPDTRHALWIAYSANKEDIWVSRIPVPVDGSETADAWNIYQPKWSTVTATGPTQVSLRTREPFDCAEAVRLFRPASRVAVSLTVTTPPTGEGAIDVALLGGAGGARPVRLRFSGDGFLRAISGDKMLEFGYFAPDTPVALRIEADCHGHGVFTVFVNGTKAGRAMFVQPVPTLQRLSIRAWARTDADRAAKFLPATAIVGREFDEPAPVVATRVSDVSIK